MSFTTIASIGSKLEYPLYRLVVGRIMRVSKHFFIMSRDTLMVYVEVVIKSILAGFIYLILKYLQECGYFNSGFNFSSLLVIGSLVLIYIVKKFIKIVKSYRFDVVIVSIGAVFFTVYAVKLNFIRLVFNALYGAATINLRYITIPVLICLLAFVIRILQKKCLEFYMSEGEAKFFSGNNPEKDLLGIEDKAKEISESLKNGGSSDPLIFGIDAPWGMGKTRFIEACFEELGKDNKVIVLKFNALRYRNQGEISEHLINELVATIKEKNYVPELDTTYKRYARILANRKNIWIDFFAALFRIDTKSYSITDTIKSLENCHKQLGKKIIVLIDDFDRLDAGVQRKTLHALSEVFHLPYVTFVICYDTENLKEKIGGQYFEKYVDVKYNLLSINPEKFKKYIKVLMESCDNFVFGDHNVEEIVQKICKDEKGKKLFNTPRKVKRLFNQIKLCSDLNKSLIKTTEDLDMLIDLLWVYINEPHFFNELYSKICGKSFFDKDLYEKLEKSKLEVFNDYKSLGTEGYTTIFQEKFKAHMELIIDGYSVSLELIKNYSDTFKNAQELNELTILMKQMDEKNIIFLYNRAMYDRDIKGEKLLTLINYILFNIQNYSVLEDDNDFGFREKGPYYLAKFIDRLGDNKKIQETIFNQEGVIEKMTDEINILKINDILVFRLTCFWGRGSSLGNLYAAMDDDKKNFENLSVTIFSKVKEYIMQGNIFALIDSLKFSELTGKYSIPELEGEKKNKVLDNEKNKLMQFVIYQLTNAERGGCGCYKLGDENIQEVMSKYIMKKIVEKEYLMRYLYVCIKSARFKFARFDEELDVKEKEKLMEDIAKTFSADSLKKCVEVNWEKIKDEEKTGYFYYNEEKVTYEEAYKEVDSYVSVWAKPEENNTQTK